MRNILGAIALSVLTTAAPAFAATPPHPGQAAAAAPGRSATPAVPGESRPGGAVSAPAAPPRSSTIAASTRSSTSRSCSA